MTDEQLEALGEFIAKRVYKRPAEQRLYPDIWARELASEIDEYLTADES